MPRDTFDNLNAEKQEKIMRAAISEFSNKGFQKGNVGIIAKNAGVAKGSMYQYFENKEELFLFSVRWALKLILKKYKVFSEFKERKMDIFDYMYENARLMWISLKEEREAIIFLQEVTMGKYSELTDKSIKDMLKVSNEYTLNFIREGKENGYIRKDMDDELLMMFMTGALMKMKGYMFEKAKEQGEEIVDQSFEENEKKFKDFVELIKHGMGVK